MEAPREFKPLKDVGTIALNETTDLRFYVDEFKGFRYGSIRTFMRGDTYSGPTKSGVTMNPKILAGMIEVLSALPKEAPSAEKELARYPKKMGVELVVRVTLFKGAAGVDVREWVDDAEYKGWSKKGVRVGWNDLPKAVSLLKEMQPHVTKPSQP